MLIRGSEDRQKYYKSEDELKEMKTPMYVFRTLRSDCQLISFLDESTMSATISLYHSIYTLTVYSILPFLIGSSRSTTSRTERAFTSLKPSAKSPPRPVRV